MDCLGHLPIRGVYRKCYRGSLSQSTVAASVHIVHRALGTYLSNVDQFVALTDGARSIFESAGFPPNKITVKPNFGKRPSYSNWPAERKGILFVGRLSIEKGIKVIADAARLAPGVEIVVLGDGPDKGLLEGIRNIKLEGRVSPEIVQQRMAESKYLLMPSIWLEGFPMVVIEAYSAGLPVIASSIGALDEIVEQGKTGLKFPVGDHTQLGRLLVHSDEERDRWHLMSIEARSRFESSFSEHVGYLALMALYGKAIEARRNVVRASG